MDSVVTFIKAYSASALITASGLTALAIAYQDYCAYVAMGPHGLPATFWGWRRQLQMSRMARKDVTIPMPYDIDTVAGTMSPHAKTSFLAEALPARQGPRPRIPGFVAPQRQISDVASNEMKDEMASHLQQLVGANTKTLQFDLSRLEGPVPAVQLLDGICRPSFLTRTRGEIIHVHPPDGSTHLVLSLADSASVIEKGWGQRHRLSGGLLPWSYTLVYAPRTKDELMVWKNVVLASLQFCSAEHGRIEKPSL